MSNDQPKNSGPVSQEHPYPPTMAPYPQPYGASYPPGYPVYYPPPPDANHTDTANGAPPGPPYMIPFAPAPGMMYPYASPPAGQGYQYSQQGGPGSANGLRPKRKQVKMACTNCANACKRCDEARPCERCIKYGIPDTCVDGVRKERQKGIKRGPYKRKGKTSTEPSYGGFTSTNGDAEWQPNGSSQSPPAAPAPPPMHTMPHFPPPEGYYPYFYPPPGFMPPGHEGQPGTEGSPNGNGQAPAMVPYYPVPPPPGYFPHYSPNGHPVAYPPPPNGAPMQTMDPGAANRSSSQSGETDGQEIEEIPPPTTTKKRARAGKNGESKSKKVKVAAAAAPAPASVGPSGGSDQVSEPGASSSGENDGGDV